jgi:chromosome segregation ATPase
VDEEEIALLEEQLANAHADLERLNGQLAEARERTTALEREAETLREQMVVSNAALAERESVLSAREAEIESLRNGVASAEERAAEAAQRFRAAVLAAEPDLPADLISGDSIEAIDASVAKARSTVERVRQHLEQQARDLRVSPGSPARGSPDLSELSAAEKIRLGLQQS